MVLCDTVRCSSWIGCIVKGAMSLAGRPTWRLIVRRLEGGIDVPEVRINVPEVLGGDLVASLPNV